MSTDTFENIERKLSVDLTGTSDTTTRSYTVSGAEDEDEALLAIDELAPSSIGVLLPKTIEVNEIGPRLFKVDVTYDFPQPKSETPDVGDETFSFDTGGATQLLVHTRFSQRTYDESGEMSTDPWGSFLNITLDEQGKSKVEGVEIGIPALSFQIRRRFANAAITFGYLRNLVLASFTTNNATFRGFAAGEVLFTHASGSQATQGDPEITYNFVASPNLTGLTIGGVSGIAKKGHEYLWIWNRPDIDTENLLLVPKVKYVSVAQVYDSSNFSLLGINV